MTRIDRYEFLNDFWHNQTRRFLTFGLILDVESHDGNRKLDHKTKSQLESIQESGIGGGGVRYAPESDSELDTLSEESEDDIEESIVLDNHDDIDQVYSIQNQSRKIRRSVSDKLKPTTSCDHDGRPRWPSSNALS